MHRPLTTFRIIGLVALAVGAILLVFAFNASNAPVDQLANTLTGRYTDNTMTYLIAGVAAVIGGGAMVMSRR